MSRETSRALLALPVPGSSFLQRPIACTLLFLFGLTATVAAQDASEERFDRIADRYWQILHENPRQGTAFERWYQHYHDGGRGAELVERLEDHVRNDPDFATHMLHGFVCEKENRPADAIAAYEAAEQIDGNRYIAPAALGLLHVRERRFSQAADCLARALGLDPPAEESLPLYEHLGRAWLRLGQRQKALLTFHDMVEAFPEDTSVLRQVAALLTEEGQFADAILRWQQIAALKDEDPYLGIEARTSIASLQLRLGRRADAIALLDATLDDVLPESWIARTIWEQIEQAFLDAEDTDGLVEFCRHRLGQHPEDLDSRLHLAHATSLAGNRDQAIREFQQAVKLAPTRRDIREQLIHQLVIAERIGEALEQCEAVARMHPDDSDALARLGELQLRHGRPGLRVVEDVVNTWKQIADLKPDDPYLALNVAELCRRTIPQFAAPESADRDDARAKLLRDTAEEFYREAIARAPSDDRYREYLGEFLHEQKRPEEAVEAWSQIASGPDATAADWHRLAEIYGAFEYLDEALAALTHAIARQPAEFEWHFQRIELLLGQEAWDDVELRLPDLVDTATTPEQQHRVRQVRIEFYRDSERIDGEIDRLGLLFGIRKATTDDVWTLALLQTERRRYPAARIAFEDVLTREPDNVLLLRDFARLQQLRGNPEEAIIVLRRIVALDPQHRLQDYEQMAVLELQLKRYNAARETVRQVIQLAPERPDTYLLQSRVELAAGAVQEGLAAQRRAVQLAPQDVGLRDLLARTLAQHQRTDEVLEQFWRCFELSDDPGEQRSLVNAMCAAAPDVPRQEQIAARLRRVRTQREDRRPLTFILVEALRSFENYESARRELELLLPERPDDLEVLHELTALSVSEEAWNEAADYQQRIVAVTGSPDDQQQLLDYFKRAGRNEEAARLNALLLDSDDPQDYLNLISDALYDDRYQGAAIIARIGLERIPENWQLQFYAGGAALLAGDLAAADSNFEAAARNARQRNSEWVARSQESEDEATERDLQAASSAYRNLTAAWEGSDDSSATGFSALASPHCPDDPRVGHVAAVVGSYVTAAASGRARNWIQNRQEGGAADPQQWRHLILVYAATETLTDNHDFVESFINRFPQDPLPHLSRLAQDRTEQRIQSLSIEQQSIERDGLRATWQWLAQNRPARRAGFVYRYGTEMLRLGDEEEAVSAFIEGLRHKSADIRRLAAVSLRSIGPPALRALPHLTARLADESTAVAIEAATTLASFGPDAAAAIPALMETLACESPALRREAALCLSRIGAESMDHLLSALESEDANVRHGAVLALYYLGPDAEPAIEALTGAANDPDKEVRRRATTALENLTEGD